MRVFKPRKHSTGSIVNISSVLPPLESYTPLFYVPIWQNVARIFKNHFVNYSDRTRCRLLDRNSFVSSIDNHDNAWYKEFSRPLPMIKFKRLMEKWKHRKRRSRIYERIANKRKEFCYKQSNKLIKNYDTLCIEDIKINKLIQKRWCSKQISDASWGMFFDILTYKAESAGRIIIKVNPSYTSQTCHKCGTRTTHELKDRIFDCSYCNYSENRDLNAAKNILRLGIQSLGINP